jgi:hypothetical protein
MRSDLRSAPNLASAGAPMGSALCRLSQGPRRQRWLALGLLSVALVSLAAGAPAVGAALRLRPAFYVPSRPLRQRGGMRLQAQGEGPVWSSSGANQGKASPRLLLWLDMGCPDIGPARRRRPYSTALPAEIAVGFIWRSRLLPTTVQSVGRGVPGKRQPGAGGGSKGSKGKVDRRWQKRRRRVELGPDGLPVEPVYAPRQLKK